MSDDEDEDEDEGFWMKWKEEDVVVLVYMWMVMLWWRVREFEEGVDVEAREAGGVWLDEGFGVVDDEDVGDVSMFVNGVLIVIIKMKSWINLMNASTGSIGVLVKIAYVEDKLM